MTRKTTEPTVSEIIKAFKKDGREFDAEFPDGTKFAGINTDDDLRRAKELMLARIDAIGPIEPQLQPELAARAAVRHRRPSAPFSKAFKPYLSEKAHDNDSRTIEDKEATYAAFIDACGDIDIGSIDKATAVAFKQALMGGNAGAARINKKIGHMSDFFGWAVAHGGAEANPFDGIRISSKSKLMEAVESYEPFTAVELDSIFDPEGYPGYAIEPHYYWLPFLLLHTGARPNELASLRLDQVRQEQGIDYFAVKKAKNSKSIRKIPWHKTVRASGFPAYVAARKKADPTGQLFPLLSATKNGHAKNVSRRFNETYLPSLRIVDPTHRLYSFRSNFITRMTELNVNPAMIMAIVGHYEQTAVDLSSPHFKNYQGVKLIGALRDTIDLFDVSLKIKF